MSGIEGVAGIGGLGQAAGVGQAAGAGQPQGADFAEALQRGVQQVSDAEAAADATAQELATGGDAELHELMAATTRAELATDVLVQVRDRAVQAYQEVMRLRL